MSGSLEDLRAAIAQVEADGMVVLAIVVPLSPIALESIGSLCLELNLELIVDPARDLADGVGIRYEGEAPAFDEDDSTGIPGVYKPDPEDEPEAWRK